MAGTCVSRHVVAFGVVISAVVTVAACGGGTGTGKPALNVHVSANLRDWAHAVRAAQMALDDAGGRAGGFVIRMVVHDESSPSENNTDPARVRRNAQEAADDPRAIAYVGDVNSGSSAISAPILNRAGLLQVSPASTYVGLTRSEGAAPGEPEKYRPSGRRTFARVMPADHVQARAGVIYAREVGIRRLAVIADETLYGRGLAALVLSADRHTGVDVVDAPAGDDPSSRAHGAIAAGADGIYLATCGAPADLVDLVERLAPVKVITGDCYVALHLRVRRRLAQLDGRLFVTAPGGGLDRTPAGRRWFARWRERIGTPADVKHMFAYEAMSAVLAAIRRAGPRGHERAAVRREFFATRNRDSILGRYSIDDNGDTTLTSYGGFAVRDGRLLFDRVLHAAP